MSIQKKSWKCYYISTSLCYYSPLDNKAYLNEIFNIFKEFGKATGSKINTSTSELMCIGETEMNVIIANRIDRENSEDFKWELGLYLDKKYCAMISTGKIGSVK